MDHHSYHYLIMSVHMMFQKELFNALKDTGLSMGQPKIIDYLNDHDGVSQKDLAFGCHIEPASLTSLLNRMEKQKLIERRMLHGNRRSLYVFLTEKGWEMSSIISRTFDRLEQNIFENIPDSDRDHLMKILEKIYETMLEKE